MSEFAHNHIEDVTTAARTVSAQLTQTGDYKASLKMTVLADTIYLAAIGIDAANLKSIYVCADHDASIDLCDGDGVTVGTSLSLTANEPYTWHTSSLDAKMVVDCATMKLTGNADDDVKFEIEVLHGADAQ